MPLRDGAGAAAGVSVDTYHVDTASSWGVNSISWIDDPTCVVTIPATGKATKVVIFYSGRGMSSTAYTAIAIRISVAGSGIVNTYRDQYVVVANSLASMATQHVYSWDGASALTVRGQASGNPCTMYNRGLSVVVIY